MASVADAIAGAAEALIMAVPDGAGTIETTAAVTTRGYPAVVEGDTFPLILVSVTDAGMEPATADDDFAYWGVYLLTVVIIRQKKGVTLDQTAGEWRQAIQRTLANVRSWTDNLSVDNVNVVRRPYLDPSKMQVGYVYTPMGFEVRTREPRS